MVELGGAEQLFAVGPRVDGRVLMPRVARCTPRFVPKHRLGCHVEHGLQSIGPIAMWDMAYVLCG
ncbi:hypothetical protein RESH_04578 [Rhodopirellula europaea SH398]|uniref:Uncharacterized protein n=1 Tax=Rhodopirellula europaea SH398 TaxID=1263868 RepID=M5SAY3_9BACT|nr:hypothetical protein RESH_04578 [Rhodopirellula europaea SH398]